MVGLSAFLMVASLAAVMVVEMAVKSADNLAA
jgi:hypothetical protein